MTETIFRANVLVCGGTGCEASNSGGVYEAVAAALANEGLQNEVQLIRTGCRGFCSMGPVMVIYPEEVWYTYVDREDVDEIIHEHLTHGRVVKRLKI